MDLYYKCFFPRFSLKLVVVFLLKPKVIALEREYFYLYIEGKDKRFYFKK